MNLRLVGTSLCLLVLCLCGCGSQNTQVLNREANKDNWWDKLPRPDLTLNNTPKALKNWQARGVLSS